MVRFPSQNYTFVIYIKHGETEGEKSFMFGLLPNCLQYPGLRQTKARTWNRMWVSCRQQAPKYWRHHLRPRSRASATTESRASTQTQVPWCGTQVWSLLLTTVPDAHPLRENSKWAGHEKFCWNQSLIQKLSCAGFSPWFHISVLSHISFRKVNSPAASFQLASISLLKNTWHVYHKLHFTHVF